MLKKLMGATGIGVVFAATASLGAYAQVAPSPTPITEPNFEPEECLTVTQPEVDELGNFILNDDGTPKLSTSFQCGEEAEASSYDSTAVGSFAKATGEESTAFGYNAQATGDFSTALGYNTQATGEGSVALGNALAGTSWLQANETHAVTANWGYYGSTNAFAFTATQRIDKNWSVNGGIGFSTDEGEVGARAGVRLGW